MEVSKSEDTENVQSIGHAQGRMTGFRYKFLKYLCFLAYTYCVYQSYVFCIALVELVIKWDSLTWELVKQGLQVFFIIPILLFELIKHPSLIQMVFVSGFWLSMLPLLAIYCGVFWLWLQVQNIYTALLVALTGQLLGPGVFLYFSMPGDGGHIRPGRDMGMIGVWILYILLIIANIVQKKYFPDSKIASRIRALIAWPCLRTRDPILEQARQTQ